MARQTRNSVNTLFQVNSTGTSIPNSNTSTAKSPTHRRWGLQWSPNNLTYPWPNFVPTEEKHIKNTIIVGDELHELQGRRAMSYGQGFYPIDQPLPVEIGPGNERTQGRIVGNSPLTTGSQTRIERTALLPG